MSEKLTIVLGDIGTEASVKFKGEQIPGVTSVSVAVPAVDEMTCVTVKLYAKNCVIRQHDETGE